MEYIKKLPTEPSFIQNGLNGFSYEIKNKNISIDIEDVFTKGMKDIVKV